MYKILIYMIKLKQIIYIVYIIMLKIVIILKLTKYKTEIIL